MLRFLGIALASIALSGCISLFPKQDPAQLYRFDGAGEAPAAQASTGPQFGVFRTRSGFVQEASGDRILSVLGNETAYVAKARWVGPASVLFDAAVARAFDANSGPARLVTRGERGATEYALRLDVRRFEAVYDRGRGSAPEIVVEVRGVLGPFRSGDLAKERMFTARVRAGDDRVGAIVDAFDAAVGQVLTETVTWTNGRGA